MLIFLIRMHSTFRQTETQKISMIYSSVRGQRNENEKKENQ